MHVALLLHSIWAIIQEAIESIDDAYPLETHVYHQFFRGVDPNKVKAVLSTIAAGPNITIEPRTYQPEIACANPDLPELASAWAFCQQTNPRINAMWTINTPWVSLCPTMFIDPELPTADDCVGQPRHGAHSTGQSLVTSQFGHLFHELVHLYLDVPALEPEIYGLWYALELSASDSYSNPSNYAFFLASR